MEPGDKKASKSVVMSVPIPAVSATARSARNPTLANLKDTGALFIGQDEFSEQFISADYFSRRNAPRCGHGLTAAARPAHPPVRHAACNRGNSPLPGTATAGDARTMRYATSRRAGITAEIPGQTLRPVIEP